MTSPPKSSAGRLPAALPLCFVILLTLSVAILLSLLSFYTSTVSRAPSLPAAHANDTIPSRPRQQARRPQPPPQTPCPHLILISAARHGSTWFIDSSTGCHYSSGLSGTYRDDVFRRTEIWTDRAGPVESISPPDALAYIRTNTSVKFMRTTLRKYADRALRLLRLAKTEQVPVVVLRRRAVQAFRSMSKARARHDWRGYAQPGDGGQGEVEEEEDEARVRTFVEALEKHFGIADELLKEAGNEMVDRLDYDDIKDVEVIRLENGRCFVRNCNFVDDE